MSTKHYAVKTADVDGGSTRTFAKIEGAIKRFEEMVGFSVDAAIAEHRHAAAAAGRPLPKIDALVSLVGVSAYGTRVEFRAISDEAIEKARVAREAVRRAGVDHFARVAGERTAFTLAAEAAFTGCEA